jgi:hypothetical protein
VNVLRAKCRIRGLQRGEENRIDRQFARLVGSNAEPEYTRFSPIDILGVNDHLRRKKLTKLCALGSFKVDREGMSNLTHT